MMSGIAASSASTVTSVPFTASSLTLSRSDERRRIARVIFPEFFGCFGVSRGSRYIKGRRFVVRNWHAILFPAILFPVGHDTGRTNVRWDFKLYVKITVTVVVDRVGARSAMKICEAIVADEIREAIRCDETP